jgi:hypothetical protein
MAVTGQWLYGLTGILYESGLYLYIFVWDGPLHLKLIATGYNQQVHDQNQPVFHVYSHLNQFAAGVCH